ncbi:MAG TPA: isopentenyl-diphosphate Delta-isomerase [archaeon]|nr:isopentenyl-diphosphate Delta-isomerase [archaeon]
MEERVVLVDAQDRQVGTEGKIAAHKAGKLHRAFSVFVFNSKGGMLVQQRAAGKYHGGGLWSNACCSHPREGESVLAAAHRKLEQEFGFDCALEEAFSFTYRADMGNELWEHEFDHVLVGLWDGEPAPNPEEIADWRWVEPSEWLADMRERPEKHTLWAREAMERVLAFWKARKK